MDVKKLREGGLQRYKTSLLSSKWKDCHAVLFSDSTLCLYNNQGDTKPAETIFLKNVVPYICVGMMTDRMPVRRPSLSPNTPIQRLVGIGMDPKAEKVHWLLFPSENDLEIWFQDIVTTLPKVQNASLSQPLVSGGGSAGQPQPYYPPPPSSGNICVPPPRYPEHLPPLGGYQANPPFYGNPQQPPNVFYGGYGPTQPQPPQQTTVIIDRTGGGGGGYGGGGSSLLASGMGFGNGMLMGSLLGYGIGSFFTPHHYGIGGYGGGFGGMGGYGGMGGGYVQDNDTYITNNYYNNDDNHTSVSSTSYNPEPVASIDHPITDGDPPFTDAVEESGVHDDTTQEDQPAEEEHDYGNDDFGGGDYDDGGDYNDDGGGDY